MAKVVEFIKRRFPTDCNWTNGNCYYFALILSNRFNGIIYYDVIDGHFICKIDNNYYDYFGIVDINNRILVEWNKFQEYDSLQYERIMQDVIQ
jgi:hypothetical protein